MELNRNDELLIPDIKKMLITIEWDTEEELHLDAFLFGPHKKHVETVSKGRARRG